VPDATCKTTLLVTLTMNPAVDLAYHARWVRPTHKSRTALDRMDAGGGGINVARVLHTLGEDVLALIMTGGVTGRLIEQMLDDAGVRWRAIAVGGLTRIDGGATVGKQGSSVHETKGEVLHRPGIRELRRSTANSGGASSLAKHQRGRNDLLVVPVSVR
jgi:sugar/nucleoside kinase (ribokinase family)